MENLKTNRSYIKVILSILARLKPLAFDDGSEVIIDNSWLKRANSRNYHHFFPKAYLKRKPEVDKLNINHILNITIVDGHSNLKIGAKAPSKYIQAFSEKNNSISDCLKTHLIGELDKFGILNDDYNKFF